MYPNRYPRLTWRAYLADPLDRVAEPSTEHRFVVGSGAARPVAEPSRRPRQDRHDSLHDDLACVTGGASHQITAAPQVWLVDQVGHRVDYTRGKPGLAQDSHRLVGGECAVQLGELLLDARGIVGAQAPESSEGVGELSPLGGGRRHEAPVVGLDGDARRIERRVAGRALTPDAQRAAHREEVTGEAQGALVHRGVDDLALAVEIASKQGGGHPEHVEQRRRVVARRDAVATRRAVRKAVEVRHAAEGQPDRIERRARRVWSALAEAR